MEQVDFIQVPEDWTDTDSLLTASLTSSNTYKIECRGDGCILQEASSKPNDTDLGGILLDGKGQKTVDYTVGTNNLYARALGKNTSLNIVDITPAS